MSERTPTPPGMTDPLLLEEDLHYGRQYPQALHITERPPYDAEFEQTLDEVVAVADDMSLEGDAWEEARNNAANSLREALRRNPDQIAIVQDTLAHMGRNVEAANKAIVATSAAYASAADEHQTARARRAHGDPAHKRPPKGAANITSPDPSASKKEINEHYDEALESQLDSVRWYRPGAGERRQRIRGYVAESRDRALNHHLVVGSTALRASMRLTGRDGLENKQTNYTFESRRLAGFQEILDGIHELGPDSDPDRLQPHFGRVETKEDANRYQADVDQALMAWRQSGSTADEQHMLDVLNNTHDFLSTVQTALDNMSQYNHRYGRLRNMHTTLSQISNNATYKYMLQSYENAAENNFDFEGRYPIRYSPEMGVYREDGNIVYYPDGSTARITASGSLDQRINANGDVWQPPRTDASQQGQASRIANRLRRGEDGPRLDVDPRRSTVAELAEGYDRAADQLFINPSDDNRLKAQAYADAILQKAEAEAARARDEADEATYTEDPQLRNTINYYNYRTLYHGFEPGVPQDSSEPHIIQEGAIELPNTTLYDTTGTWRLWPTGEAEQYDGYGNVIQHYAANGTRL